MDIKEKQLNNSGSHFSLSSSYGAIRMHDLKEDSDENLNEHVAIETASMSCPGKDIAFSVEKQPPIVPLRRANSDLSRVSSETNSSSSSKPSENRFSADLAPKLNVKLHNFAKDTKQFLRRRSNKVPKSVKPYPEIKAKEIEEKEQNDDEENEKTPVEVGQEAADISRSSSQKSSIPFTHPKHPTTLEALGKLPSFPHKQPETMQSSIKKTLFGWFGRFWKEICLLFLILLTLFSPLPSFLCGLLWGVYLSSLVFRLILWLYLPIDQDDRQWSEDQQQADATPLTEEDLLRMDTIVYKGWMNVYRRAYDPEKYHIGSTKSVLVRLDRDVLRLSIPKTNILKQSSWNETKIEPTFISQEMYNIAGAIVTLRPKGLAKRRWWSRKYPICICFARDAVVGVAKQTNSDTSVVVTHHEHKSSDETGETSEDEISLDGLSMVTTNSSNSLPMQMEMESDAVKKSRKKRKRIYLFARSSREKEQWFHQFRKAAGQHAYRTDILNERRAVSESEMDTRELNQLALDWILYTSLQKQFAQNMEAFVTKIEEAKDIFVMDLGLEMWKPTNRVTAEISSNKENITWANALAARVFLDFSKDPNWIQRVKSRIERKMETIHLPYFIETLKLAKLEPGYNTPRITSVYEPQVNEWGLWVDVNVEYSGGIHLMLETKLNLMKLKADVGGTSKRKGDTPTRYSDEELPESPESSADEEPPILPFLAKKEKKEQKESPKESTGKKILHFVDKITQSKYFQDATENKYVKKLMQGVSDTPLILMVDVVYLEGTLALNIPTPPSDRIWYGFRCPPKLILRARPKVGDRSLNLTHVTDWIENKLCFLLEKFLVIPNMDDLIVPLMSGSPLFRNMNK